ncbi:MAG: amidoligase family protein, partial [Myxococcales bacterium]|nr:amidoligase family protein [Myxococcales bacterium]
FRGTVEYRYFDSTLHAGKVKAYIQFCLALSAKAIGAKRAVSARRAFDPSTSKYDFRCFLLRLGLIGPEFKTARLHLLARLGGSAAWKGERRDGGAV